jgi:hypothetical protein
MACGTGTLADEIAIAAYRHAENLSVSCSGSFLNTECGGGRFPDSRQVCPDPAGLSWIGDLNESLIEVSNRLVGTKFPGNGVFGNDRTEVTE